MRFCRRVYDGENVRAPRRAAAQPSIKETHHAAFQPSQGRDGGGRRPSGRRPFQEVICAKPACVLGLATGSSPVPLYRELIARERAGLIDFSRVRSVNLDEYKGLAPDHPQSYRRFMQENLFNHISIGRRTPMCPTA